jgi:hypothetical protein
MARVTLPDGRWVWSDFDGRPASGQPLEMDGIAYVIREVGHLAVDQRRRSRRMGRERRFVVVVRVEPQPTATLTRG